MGDHQVKENAWITVLEGSACVSAGGETVEATPGMLFRFDPDERHSLASDEGARILLLLAPWPGEGHYRGSGLTTGFSRCGRARSPVRFFSRAAALVGAPHHRVHEVAERQEEAHQHDRLEDLLRQRQLRPSSITVISISGKKRGPR